MSYEEKNTWAGLVVTIGTVVTYLVIIVGKADGGPLVDVDYQATMLWMIGISIAVTIVLTILVSIATGETRFRRDQRDREIGAFGGRMGQSFMVIGGVAALAMALAEWDWFWIANVLYLCFALSAVAEGVAKVIAYRKGVPAW